MNYAPTVFIMYICHDIDLQDNITPRKIMFILTPGLEYLLLLDQLEGYYLPITQHNN